MINRTILETKIYVIKEIESFTVLSFYKFTWSILIQYKLRIRVYYVMAAYFCKRNEATDLFRTFAFHCTFLKRALAKPTKKSVQKSEAIQYIDIS